MSLVVCPLLVSGSPVSSLPFPGAVGRAARLLSPFAGGPVWLSLRPSVRSSSGWVVVVYFGSESLAVQFASASGGFRGRFGSWFVVGVPVCVQAWVSVPGSCPVLFAPV
ncbi:MAG: hypothetical protein LRZ84_22905 [Desertifilum sp.]|nr:hypothetical protein [Desertifilum sp.]